MAKQDADEADDPSRTARSGSVEPWAALDSVVLGLPDPADPVVGVNDLLGGFGRCVTGESFLAFTEFGLAAELYGRLVEPVAESDVSLIDAFAQCAARIAIAHAMSQRAAEQLLSEAVALRDRLPQVATCLRDGVMTRRQTTTIISRTALAEGQDYALEVDATIASAIRGRRGVWSLRAIRDLADRVLFRHDPAAIRERRERALGERAVWVDEEGEGMAVVSASMSAENARLAVGRVRALAKTACRHDRRGVRARNSDAAFALLSGTAFECTCGRAGCDAQIPEAGMLPPEAASIVIHVVCDAATLADPADTTPAVLDGYGVISADHARELAERPDAVVHHPNLSHQVHGNDSTNNSRPAACVADATDRNIGDTRAREAAADRGDLGEVGDSIDKSAAPTVHGTGTVEENQEESAAGTGKSADARPNSVNPDPEPDTRRAAVTAPPPSPKPPGPASEAQPCPKPGGLAPHLASDPYRPSAALDLYLRARDMTCAVPGCTRAAFDCDLDHVREYDHADPTAGGLTYPAGMNAKCRFHHLLKTFGDFVDDQTLVDGRPQTTFITPEGLALPGRADSGLDVLPALATIEFLPPATGRTIRDADTPPRRPTPRTAQRHARREQERRRNRDRNTAGPPPPF